MSAEEPSPLPTSLYYIRVLYNMIYIQNIIIFRRANIERGEKVIRDDLHTLLCYYYNGTRKMIDRAFDGRMIYYYIMSRREHQAFVVFRGEGREFRTFVLTLKNPCV